VKYFHGKLYDTYAFSPAITKEIIKMFPASEELLIINILMRTPLNSISIPKTGCPGRRPSFHSSAHGTQSVEHRQAEQTYWKTDGAGWYQELRTIWEGNRYGAGIGIEGL